MDATSLSEAVIRSGTSAKADWEAGVARMHDQVLNSQTR